MAGFCRSGQFVCSSKVIRACGVLKDNRGVELIHGLGDLPGLIQHFYALKANPVTFGVQAVDR
jgi:hypothetical protein